jgi:hypothetical protein
LVPYPNNDRTAVGTLMRRTHLWNRGRAVGPSDPWSSCSAQCWRPSGRRAIRFPAGHTHQEPFRPHQGSGCEYYLASIASNILSFPCGSWRRPGLELEAAWAEVRLFAGPDGSGMVGQLDSTFGWSTLHSRESKQPMKSRQREAGFADRVFGKTSCRG